jgi:hypothetical protein
MAVVAAIPEGMPRVPSTVRVSEQNTLKPLVNKVTPLLTVRLL